MAKSKIQENNEIVRAARAQGRDMVWISELHKSVIARTEGVLAVEGTKVYLRTN